MDDGVTATSELAIGISDRPIAMVEEAVDCVVRLGCLSDTTHIVRTLYDDRLVTCASPDYVARRGLPLTPAALRDHDLVGYFSALTARAWPLRFVDGDDDVLVDTIALRSNDSAGMTRMIAAGLGIGQVFFSTAQPFFAAGRLVPILASSTRHTEPVQLLYPHARGVNARTRAFIDWLVAHLRGAATGSSLP